MRLAIAGLALAESSHCSLSDYSRSHIAWKRNILTLHWNTSTRFDIPTVPAGGDISISSSGKLKVMCVGDPVVNARCIGGALKTCYAGFSSCSGGVPAPCNCDQSSPHCCAHGQHADDAYCTGEQTNAANNKHHGLSYWQGHMTAHGCSQGCVPAYP